MPSLSEVFKRGVNLRIQSKYRKIRTRKNTMFGHFLRSVTHKEWIYHRVNIFELTGMVYCNSSSLVILISKAKYIPFLPIFPTSSSPFTLHVEAIHKVNWILLISQQMFVKLFFSNRIIGISYNLNKYIQYKQA